MQFLTANALILCCLVAAAHGAGAEDDASDDVCPAGDARCSGDTLKEDGMSIEIKKLCPLVDGRVTPLGLWLAKQLSKPTGLLQMVGLWPKGIEPSTWADEYVVVSYLAVVRLTLGFYKSRDSSWVNVPTLQGSPDDAIQAERIDVPQWDVDGTPNFMWFEGLLPEFVVKYFYAPSLTCFQSLLRRLSTDNGLLNGTFDDMLNDSVLNRWETVLAGSPYKTKLDWTMAFYDIAKAWDGKPLWPTQMTNFQTYWKQDEYDDMLEYAIAFRLIGSHRVESGSWRFENLTGIDSVELPFRVPLNVFSGLEVRKHFSKYGADLYFNEDGLPVLLQTPAGDIILRGDKQWQYWKFVWRSTLITGITFVDHLHFTHFRTSNFLAKLSRNAMPPKHPMRRITSIFSFGAIFVNLQAMHTLVGANHMLHRATPFKHFAQLSDKVPAAESGLLPDVIDVPGIKTLFHDKIWDKLHPKLQEAPFFADGRLIAQAIRKFLVGVFESARGTFCDSNGAPTEFFKTVRDAVVNETMHAGYAFDMESYASGVSCTVMRDVLRRRMEAYIFSVTAWHRHVGFVGDYYKDPHLATMSWKEGEAFGRPKQHFIMTLINVFTSTNQPYLKEDYTHLFKGMEPDLEDDFVRLWRAFQTDLQEAEEEIDRRNTKRDITNINMSPKVLESAVSK